MDASAESQGRGQECLTIASDALELEGILVEAPLLEVEPKVLEQVDDNSSTVSVSSQGSEEQREIRWRNLKRRYQTSKYVIAKLKHKSRIDRCLSCFIPVLGIR